MTHRYTDQNVGDQMHGAGMARFGDKKEDQNSDCLDNQLKRWAIKEANWTIPPDTSSLWPPSEAALDLGSVPRERHSFLYGEIFSDP